MSRKLSKSYFLVSARWGIKIDFVGTVWVLSYFLYDKPVAFPVSAITALYCTIFSAAHGSVGQFARRL